MGKERLAAFSDGVIAIIITIMVLELKIPHGADWAALSGMLPNFISYALSFVYLAIYWNNHHHMLQAVERVDGLVLWANCNLLFWLSLVPVATAWAGENPLAHIPTAVYGVTLLMPALAYVLLERALLRKGQKNAALARALGHGLKEKLSPLVYVTAIVCAFFVPWVSIALYVVVAVTWFIPDRRIEKVLP